MCTGCNLPFCDPEADPQSNTIICDENFCEACTNTRSSEPAVCDGCREPFTHSRQRALCTNYDFGDLNGRCTFCLKLYCISCAARFHHDPWTCEECRDSSCDPREGHRFEYLKDGGVIVDAYNCKLCWKTSKLNNLNVGEVDEADTGFSASRRKGQIMHRPTAFRAFTRGMRTSSAPKPTSRFTTSPSFSSKPSTSFRFTSASTSSPFTSIPSASIPQSKSFSTVSPSTGLTISPSILSQLRLTAVRGKLIRSWYGALKDDI
ncbi:hypothetical protein BC829DRAFT_441676 [Chytridium lagenaria]|nr:hypothetical protein BC829DRAFT_441676 [Chytridium lagenaria]